MKAVHWKLRETDERHYLTPWCCSSSNITYNPIYFYMSWMRAEGFVLHNAFKSNFQYQTWGNCSWSKNKWIFIKQNMCLNQTQYSILQQNLKVFKNTSKVLQLFIKYFQNQFNLKAREKSLFYRLTSSIIRELTAVDIFEVQV